MSQHSKHSDLFARLVAGVLAREGGYVNDPADAGGETKYGISKRAYPDLDIAALTQEDAAEIYHRDYWLPIRGDDLPRPLAAVVFDAAVNHGVRRAAVWLQYEVRAKADGVIGPQTLAAVAAVAAALTAATNYTDRRLLFYVDLARAKSSQLRFLPGWVGRAVEVRREVFEAPP